MGDPPNIMIGSATGLVFMDFMMNLALPVSLILVLTISCLVLIYKKNPAADSDKIERLMKLNEIDYIREWLILKKISATCPNAYPLNFGKVLEIMQRKRLQYAII